MVLSGTSTIRYLNDAQKNLTLDSSKNISRIRDNISPQDASNKNIHRNFDKLIEENEDTVAYLFIKNTEINIPIVKKNDNSYYLTHNFDNESDPMGWAFADKDNDFDNLSSNTIIYGNLYNENNTLSNLKKVLNENWLNNKENYKIIFDTKKERFIFEVFSIYKINRTNDFLNVSFDSKNDYQEYLNKSLQRSIKNFNNEVTVDDKIITLTTGLDKDKVIVVQAKLIRPE